jgi:hypothetical protein
VSNIMKINSECNQDDDDPYAQYGNSIDNLDYDPLEDERQNDRTNDLMEAHWSNGPRLVVDNTVEVPIKIKMAPLVPNKSDIAAHLYALFDPAFVQPYPEAWFEVAYCGPDGDTHKLKTIPHSN